MLSDSRLATDPLEVACTPCVAIAVRSILFGAALACCKGGSGGGGTGIAGIFGISEAGMDKSGAFTETTDALGIVKDFSVDGTESFIGGGGTSGGGPGTGSDPLSTTLGRRRLTLIRFNGFTRG